MPDNDGATTTRVRYSSQVKVTATGGWRSGTLASLYPKGIPIGVVTNVGSLQTDLYQQVQISSGVDFQSLDSVLVLVARDTDGARP